MGVSRTPISLALARLEGEGLVHRVEGKGWVLRPIGLEDVKEIFELKVALEPLNARLAAERATAEAALELMSTVAEMQEASDAQDLDKWLDSDRRYHQHLFDMAGNSLLAHCQTKLNNQLGRLWQAYSSMKGQMAMSCLQHRRIAEAIAAGDPDGAAQAAYDHVVSLRTSLVDVMTNVLIPFLSDEL
jgi:DNA-binding GntR family transcriptional regulator